MEAKNDPLDATSGSSGPIGEAVDFAVEVAEKGHLPDVPSFYTLAEGLSALNMEETLIKLIEKIMSKAEFSDNEVAMIRGFLKCISELWSGSGEPKTQMKLALMKLW